MARILILGEDKEVFDLLSHILRQEGHHVRFIQDARRSLSSIENFLPHLVIVDSTEPSLTAPGVFSWIRTSRPLARARVLALTPQDANGMEAVGPASADAYLKRPLDARTVLSCVKVLVRQADQQPTKIVIEDLVIDPLAYRVTRAGLTLPLSTLEFRLLHYLASHPNEVCRRDRLLQQVWEMPNIDRRTIDVCVRKLRKAVERSPEKPALIRSIRGQGYMFYRQLEPSRGVLGKKAKADRSAND